MLHDFWPSQDAVSPPPPVQPVPPQLTRKRSNEPKPFVGLTQLTALRAVRPRDPPSQAAASKTTHPHGAAHPPPSCQRHLSALWSACGLCLARLAGVGPPPRQWPSEQWPLAAMLRHSVCGLLSRDARHHLPRHPGGGRAAPTRHRVPGRRPGHAGHGARIRSRAPYRPAVAGGGRRAASGLDCLLAPCGTDPPAPARRVVGRAECRESRQHGCSRGHRSLVALTSLGLDRDRSREPTAAARPERGTHPGDGSRRVAAARAAVGARVCAALVERRGPQFSHRPCDAWRALDAAPSAPGPRPRAHAALEATAWTPLRAGGPRLSVPAACRGEASRGLRHNRGGRSALGRLRLAPQHLRRCTAPSAPPSAGGSAREAQRYAVSERRWVGPATSAVPSLSHFWGASRQRAPSARCPDFHVWNRRGQGGATVYPGHGSWTHRSCVEPKRGAAVPRATVATAPDALRNGAAF